MLVFGAYEKKATQSFRWNPIKKEDGSGRFHKRKTTTQMRKMLTEIC